MIIWSQLWIDYLVTALATFRIEWSGKVIINCVTLHLDDWKSKSQLLQVLFKNGFNFYKELVPKQSWRGRRVTRTYTRWRSSEWTCECALRLAQMHTKAPQQFFYDLSTTTTTIISKNCVLTLTWVLLTRPPPPVTKPGAVSILQRSLTNWEGGERGGFRRGGGAQSCCKTESLQLN